MYQLLLIDKSANMTSHDIVNDLRRHLHIRRIGHAGTLDPFATGLMILLIDQATKLSKYYMDHDKTYEARITLGFETDTLDMTGSKIKESDASKITEAEIQAEIKKMIGKSLQIPPAYSAIKKDGKKLVDLARKNQELPVLEPRAIEVFSMSEATNFVYEGKTVSFDVILSVSKGTYIRAIARDLGYHLKTFGTLTKLRRTRVGVFSVENASCLEMIHSMDYRFIDAISNLELPHLCLSDEWIKYVENGRFLPLDLFPDTRDTILYNTLNMPVAIYTYDKEKQIMRMSVLLK